MIDDLDRTLRELLIQEMPRVMERIPQGGFDVKFDVPNREFKGQVAVPTLCLYLYHIQENRDMRGQVWGVHRENSAVVTRRPPVRLDCSYMVTAWSLGNVEDEHRLLAGAARVFFRNPVLPQGVLQGVLADDIEVTTEVAQPESFKDVVDIWSVLDNDLRPSIRLTVLVPLELDVARVATAVYRPIHVGMSAPQAGTGAQRRVDVSGVLTARQQPVGGARIRIDSQSSDASDVLGRFRLHGVLTGTRAVLVEVDGVLHQFQEEVAPELHLRLPVTVRGQLTRDGTPVAAAGVTVGTASALTDAEGNFVLENVPPGRECKVWIEEGGTVHRRLTKVSDAADDAEVHIELARISANGRVVKAGVAVRGARVTVDLAAAETTNDGRFVLNSVSQGPAVIRVTERDGTEHEFEADIATEVTIELPQPLVAERSGV